MTTDRSTASEAEQAREQQGRDWFHYAMTRPREGDFPSPFVRVASNNFCFADVWSRPGLDMRARRFITIACAGFVGADTPMRTHLYAALKSGDITWEEMQEAILHFSVYAGLPKASLVEQVAAECWARVQAEGGPVKLEPPAGAQP